MDTSNITLKPRGKILQRENSVRGKKIDKEVRISNSNNKNKPRRKQVDMFIRATKPDPEDHHSRKMIRKIALASQNSIQNKSTLLVATKKPDENNKFITKGINPPNNHGIDLVPIKICTNLQLTDRNSQ